jgi:hypothetical protein
MAEDFDGPLPDNFLAAFYGEDIAEAKPAKQVSAKRVSSKKRKKR